MREELRDRAGRALTALFVAAGVLAMPALIVLLPSRADVPPAEATPPTASTTVPAGASDAAPRGADHRGASSPRPAERWPLPGGPSVTGSPAAPAVPPPSASTPGGDTAPDGTLGPGEARELIAQELTAGLAAALPERRFSPEDVERMTDLLLEMRTARLALSRLPYTPEASAERDRLQRALGDAAARLAAVAGVGAQELTDRLQPGVGLTQPGSDDDAPVLETLPSPP